MGNLLILNGSPRAPRSNSKGYASLFAACWKGEAVYLEAAGIDPGALSAALEGARQLLLVFPLYVDALPVPLMRTLQALEKAPPRNRPTVSVLINCGFLEPHQNDAAVEMVQLFCRRNGYPFGSVLKIGGGEAILDTPFRFLAARKIRQLARAMIRDKHRTLTVTMPLPKKLYLSASTGYWVRYGEKRGITKPQMETMAIEPETAPDAP